MASVKNLASGTLVSAINTTDTALTVNVGNGTSAQLLGVWPSVPFYITVAPSSPSSGVTNSLDSEIMLVTSIKTGTSTLNMTVTRAQRDTTAKAFNADDIVTNAVYAEDAVFAAPNGTLESPSPWIETGDIKDSQVTPTKLENSNAYDRFAAIGGTQIPDNSDLNTLAFLGVGMYYCETTNSAGTLTNCPAGVAFTMRVYQSHSSTIKNETTDTWVYRVREITDYAGRTWKQYASSGNTAGSFTFSSWYQFLDNRNVKSLAAVSDAGWSGDKDKIPDISMLSYWNGAYSGTASNLKYFSNNSITGANLNKGNIRLSDSGGYTSNVGNKYEKLMRIAVAGNWKTAAARFTFASTQSSTFAFDVLFQVRRTDSDVEVVLTAQTLRSHTHDLKSRLTAVRVDANTVDLYWKTDGGGSGIAHVYDFTTMDQTNTNYGVLTLYRNELSDSLPSGTQTAVTMIGVDASVDVTSTAIAATSGFTVTGSVRKVGCMVFMNIVVKKNSGNFTNSQETVASIGTAYRPISALNTYCSLSSSEWQSTNVGYAYIDSNILVADHNSTGRNWAKISVAYVVA